MKKIQLIICALYITALCSCQTSQTEAFVYRRASKDNPIKITSPWCSSVNLGICTVFESEGITQLTKNHYDFKPSWSLEKDQITFFRSDRYMGPFDSWKTNLCSINADGSDLHILTGGKYADFNPTWTRDGSHKIIFNRYARKGPYHCEVYSISPDGKPGDEVLISDPDFRFFEWAMSCLKDGRIFVEKTTLLKTQSFLLTQSPGKKGKYEEISRPTKNQWHKLSISPDETKVCYMLDNNNDTTSYEDVVIAYAEFDKDNLIIRNQKIITEYNLSNIFEYPRWTPDGTHIVYDSNKSGNYQIYAYRLADGVTERISEFENLNYNFAHFRGAPK